MDNQERVLAAMKEAGKPVRPGDLATITGICSKDVSKAIQLLKKESRIFSPKRCFYSPAEE